MISSRFLIKFISTCFNASASKTIGFLIFAAKTLNSFEVSLSIPEPGPINTASTLSAISRISSECLKDNLSPSRDLTIKSGEVDLMASADFSGVATYTKSHPAPIAAIPAIAGAPE